MAHKSHQCAVGTIDPPITASTLPGLYDHTAMNTDFEPNTKVQHPGKPEWGVGTVLSAQRGSHEGSPCQRLTVRFSGAGKKTINTAFAKLIRLEDAAPLKQPPLKAAPSAGAPLRPATPAPAPRSNEPTPDKTTIAERLAHLPDELADPFRPLDTRLTETLASYRYQSGDRTLLAWAVAQTGMTDPLSVLSRHELEEHFTNYQIRLDRHLKTLLEEARRARFDTRPIISASPPRAQHALRRINPGR